MNEALNVRLASLPDDTVTYVGHEYTASNIAFGKSVDPTNGDVLSLLDYTRKNEVTTGKFTIGDEKKHNVFMRLDSDAVQGPFHARSFLVWIEELMISGSGDSSESADWTGGCQDDSGSDHERFAGDEGPPELYFVLESR